MKMKTINNILKEIFRRSDKPLHLPEIYLIVFKEGHPNNMTTKNSVRGLIRNLMGRNEVKRVSYSTYIQT